MDKSTAKRVIDASMGRTKADVVFRNAMVVDVFNCRSFKSDVYVKDGRFIGFDGDREAEAEVDAKGRYMIPGFIDSHCHIESSHLSPSEFSDAVLPSGTTSVVADPHEICNVAGMDALRYMLCSAENAVLNINYMFPSCVPCTFFEHSGAVLEAKEIESVIDNPKILGLGEMMNYPGVTAADDSILSKLDACWKRGKVIDGHIPSISGQGLDAYLSALIATDHECETPEELVEKTGKGMYVLLRQGTVCKNVLRLVPGINDNNWRRCLFCTDDRQPQSILREGHINYGVNLAISQGLDPYRAIACATINAADCYHMWERGAITPGRIADFFFSSSLTEIKAEEVYVGGEKVAEGGKIVKKSPKIEPKGVSGLVNIKDLSLSTFSLPLTSDRARVIEILPGGVVTAKGEADVIRDEKGEWVHDESQDVLKVTVIERHHGTGHHASALIRGYGLKHGAIATTIAHDSHNIIVVGDNDMDMLKATEKLVGMGGGITAFKDGKELASHKLEIAGLMTDETVGEVVECLDELHDAVDGKMEGINPEIDPFMTLCFMALPVIPAYKITDCGLFDVTEFKFVDVSI
ncbi:MAG: adenine deaminase [Candidatus Ornithospirochaeta sp.]